MGGSRYFLRGLRLLAEPGIRPLVIMPILINLVLFASLSVLLYGQIQSVMSWLETVAGQWVAWILWLLWVLAAAVWLVAYGYIFAYISQILASPFYGLLAEKVQAHLTSTLEPAPFNFRDFFAMAARSFIRELKKLAYFVPRLIGVALLCLALSFIPVIALAAPVLYFLWGAWSTALESLDFAADNNQVDFSQLRRQCRTRRTQVLGFGALALAGATIPIFNLVALPAAVAGGTALWVERFAEHPPQP